jgi:hypothetical protein
MPLLDAAGTFDCKVLDAEQWIGQNANSGTMYVGLPLEVISEGPHKGKHITHYGYLSEKAIDNTVAALSAAFGFDGDLGALHRGHYSFAEMLCSITTELQEYQGKQQCKVKWLNPYGSRGGNGITGADDQAVTDFLSKFGGRAKAIGAQTLKETGKAPMPSVLPPGAGRPSAASAAPAAAPPAQQNEELPF